MFPSSKRYRGTRGKLTMRHLEGFCLEFRCCALNSKSKVQVLQADVVKTELELNVLLPVILGVVSRALWHVKQRRLRLPEAVLRCFKHAGATPPRCSFLCRVAVAPGDFRGGGGPVVISAVRSSAVTAHSQAPCYS